MGWNCLENDLLMKDFDSTITTTMGVVYYSFELLPIVVTVTIIARNLSGTDYWDSQSNHLEVEATVKIKISTFFIGIYYFTSSFGMMSIRKSNISVLYMHAAISLFFIYIIISIIITCSVLLLPSSVNYHARWVSSMINISQALANKTGASAEIIYSWFMRWSTLTSSSDFIIFLTRASGNWWFLNTSGSWMIKWLYETFGHFGDLIT